MADDPDHDRPARRAVVVLSMHRSGTSALTRMLGLLGCDLPATLIPGRAGDNETGFWESQPVVDLNEAICASAGSFWNDWLPLDEGWLGSPLRQAFAERAQAVLRDELGASRLFVLKDPRLCRLMPVWQDALAGFGASPAYVVALRNPFEVAASLQRRNGIGEGGALLAWLRHMLDAERHSRGAPRVFVDYDDLLSDWRRQADRIAQALGMAWPNRSLAGETAIDGFLSPQQRHHRVDAARVLGDGRLSPWFRDAFAVFDRWARDALHEGDTAVLDRIGAELIQARPAFERVVAEAADLARQSSRLQRDLDRTRERLATGKADARELRKARDGEAARNRDLTARNRDLAARLKAAEAGLARRDGQIATLRKALEVAREAQQAERAARQAERDRHAAAARALGQEIAGLAGQAQAITTVARQLLQAHMATLRRGIGPAGAGRLGRLLARFDLLRRRRLQRTAAGLRAAGLIDPDWYAARYADVAASGADPALHFVEHGFAEGRLPAPVFEDPA